MAWVFKCEKINIENLLKNIFNSPRFYQTVEVSVVGAFERLVEHIVSFAGIQKPWLMLDRVLRL